jgi:hypothetical protein
MSGAQSIAAPSHQLRMEKLEMLTFECALRLVSVDVPDHLEAQAAVPVLTGLQHQGDILIRPVAETPGSLTWQLVGDGVQVVTGEATGNTHWLHADEQRLALWARVDRGQVVGYLTVPAGAAYLIHTEEHGANGIGVGQYELRRKREQADEIRIVAD